MSDVVTRDFTRLEVLFPSASAQWDIANVSSAEVDGVLIGNYRSTFDGSYPLTPFVVTADDVWRWCHLTSLWVKTWIVSGDVDGSCGRVFGPEWLNNNDRSLFRRAAVSP